MREKKAVEPSSRAWQYGRSSSSAGTQLAAPPEFSSFEAVGPAGSRGDSGVFAVSGRMWGGRVCSSALRIAMKRSISER